MKVNLRPYQRDCKKAIKEKFDSGVTRQLIVEATGLGKRLQAVDLTRHFKRTLFIAHREELIVQAYEEIDSLDPMNAGIIKGKLFEVDKKIVVASIQTLYNRLDKIDPEMFDLLIVDEAHHYVSPTYLKSIQHFKPRLFTAWTATPKRLDGLSLTNIVDDIVFEYRIEDGIKEKFLAPIEAYQIQTQTSLKGIKKVAGDFNQKQLSERVDTELRNNLIAGKYIEYASNSPGIAFCVDIDHCYNLRDKLRENGISAEAIVSDTYRCPNRDEIVADFKDGKIDVLTNVNILCLDLETEILTQRGWLKHDEMTYDDLVANYTIEGKIFFKKPEMIVKRKLYEFEKMVTAKTRQTNIRVTNTHRMIYKTGANGAWHKTAAENLINKSWIYPSCGYADPIRIKLEQPYVVSSSKRKKMITDNAYNLRKINKFKHIESRIEATKRVDHKLSLRYKNPDQLTLDECRLIGFWLGDGSLNKLIKKGVEYTICQSKVYPGIIKYIDSLLESNNLDYIKRDKGGYFTWSIGRGTGSGIQQKRGLFHIEPYLDKNGTELFWGLDKIQISALIEGLWYADGLHGQALEIPDTKVIGSTFHSLLSILQAVLVCRGFKANIRKTKQGDNPNHSDLYILVIENRKVQSLMSEKEEYKLQYDSVFNSNEEVWCVKTESKNIITRREGRVCIMGNTEGFDYEDIGCIMMARPTQSETLYVQSIGRGTRLKSEEFKNKHNRDNCIVLDFVDNTDRHSLVNSWELEADKNIEERMFVPPKHKEMLIAEKEKREREMIIRHKERDEKIDLLELPKIRVWDSPKMQEPASEAQLKWIKNLGVYQEGLEYTKAMASELISNQPAKYWQMKYLKNLGYDVSNGATFGQYQKAKWLNDNRNKFVMKK